MTDHCFNCRFWLDSMLDDGDGVCRRYPPNAFSRFPTVGAGAWCGEFQDNDPTEKIRERFPSYKIPSSIFPDEIRQVLAGDYRRLAFCFKWGEDAPTYWDPKQAGMFYTSPTDKEFLRELLALEEK